jgi:hypothetical protein
MADAIELMDSDDHGNVTYSMSGQTPTLVGLKSGSIPLNLQLKGDAVDVSTYSTLRLALDVTDVTNKDGTELGLPHAASLHVAIEHSADGVNWSLLHTFDPQRGLGSQRVVLGAFEDNVRASWWFVRHDSVHTTVTDQVAFTWSLTGEALPETA